MHRVKQRPAGMLAFTIVWFGQLVSLIGSGLTLFALTLWAWQETGSATALALVGVFSFTPLVLMSPIAGALVDRWNRKLVMMLSDLAAGISTIVVLLLYLTDSLEIWHLYITGAFAGAFSGLPVASLLGGDLHDAAEGAVRPGQWHDILCRGGGGDCCAYHGRACCSGPLGIAGIMAIDIATFAVAISTLLVIVVPQPKRTAAGEEARGSLLKESVYGFRYILSRPSLLGLQLVFLANNLAHNFSAVVITPMILSRTGNNEEMLGIVLSAGGVGGVVGGFVMSGWGGPKRRVPWRPRWDGSWRDRRHTAHGRGPLTASMGRGIVYERIPHPHYQRLQPGHLAGEGCPRRAGPRFLGQAHDRLDCHPAGAASRRANGGLRLRAGDAAGWFAGRNVRLARRHRPRSRHGP
ncbi:MAG: hypothetical protein KatS3mg057_0137 [Herpetosiphonaceae bacterium]|nr:MAG: hypothetical protein KatS3mg057_0137 [Herpetosiphonaceae bacterium]